MKFVVTFKEPIYSVGAFRVAPDKPIKAVVISDYTIANGFLTCTTTDHNRKVIVPIDNVLALCESFD